MCTFYHYHQIGSITHLPLFRATSWRNGTVRAVCLSILFWSNVDYDIELWWSEYIPMINHTSFIYSFSLLDFISTSSVRLTLPPTYYSMIFCFKYNIERDRFRSSKTKINDFHIDPFDACLFIYLISCAAAYTPKYWVWNTIGVISQMQVWNGIKRIFSHLKLLLAC